MPVVFALRLEDDGSPDSKKKYVRLPPPVKSRPYLFRLVITAGSLASRDAKLYTNYPEAGFFNDGIADATCQISVEKPGVFEYYVEYTADADPADSSSTSRRVRAPVNGAFIIEPFLSLRDDSISEPSTATSSKILLPLDGITILTVIPKWMPTLSGWPDHFASFAETGYNMVHFAPLNVRGSSNSPYSIYDQLAISDDLFDTPGLKETEKERLLAEELKRIEEENGILSITDVVWNHTACNSEWLSEHPESGYNLKTAPHLRSAYELDEALMRFSDEIVTVHKKSPIVRTDAELDQIIDIFKSTVLPSVKLWEFYIVDVPASVTAIRTAYLAPRDSTASSASPFREIYLGSMSKKERADLLHSHALVSREDGTRFAKSLALAPTVAFLDKLAADIGNSNVDHVIGIYEEILSEINLNNYREHDDDVRTIIEQVHNRAKYLRVAEHGPKLGPISRSDPIVDTYFTRLPQNEVTKNRHPDELMLANNGWIWNADPLLNFAGPGSKAYLRREVIAWGDCTKLRYGDRPEDNPWLWSHQIEYTRKMARLFHGFRIDNCHSTPIHVAAHLLDEARAVRPDLYVFAELFTGSEDKDITFVAKLGINSLIREAMNAWDAHELSRLAHRFGGEPVELFPLDILGHEINSNLFTPVRADEELIVNVQGSTPHALFMDCTHDNETPHQRRTAADTLPNAAVVAMANCAVGSVKGYDEIVPELLNVVTETRKYRVPAVEEGIIHGKPILSASTLYGLHARMAREGYTEIHVNQEHDFISIHRVHPITHDGYLLIARTAFKNGAGKDGKLFAIWCFTELSDQASINTKYGLVLASSVHSPIVLLNQAVHVIESAGLKVHTPPYPSEYLCPIEHSETDQPECILPHLPINMYHRAQSEFPDSPDSKRIRVGKPSTGTIEGLPAVLGHSNVLTTRARSRIEDINDGGDCQTVIEIVPERFEPGGIVLYRTWVVGSGVEDDAVIPRSSDGNSTAISIPVPNGPNPGPAAPGPLKALWDLMGLDRKNAGIEMMVRLGWDILGANHLWYASDRASWPPGLWDAVQECGMLEINAALYRSEDEERDVIGEGAYNVPGHVALPYCGLQGFVSALQPIARGNDLGHPIFDNLRKGPWMADYTVSRLKKYAELLPALAPLRDWLSARLSLLRKISPSFVPKYFTLIIFCAYHGLRYRAVTLARTTSPPTLAGFLAPASKHRNISSLRAFAQACAMTTYQLHGRVASTGLFPGKYPLGPVGLGPGPDGHGGERDACLAAGLTHFATHHMRCWGRDVFISLRGLMLLPGHLAAARAHILAFGSTLRHGLIPNLLDQGMWPRYNARDASWFWIMSVIDYCRVAPEGLAFLGTTVARRFVSPPEFHPDSPPSPHTPDVAVEPTHPASYSQTSTVAGLIYEILARHAQGISFRENNAGPNLDHAMRSEGFDVTAYARWTGPSPGLIYGGSRFNCGTWMDKMGDSDKAGTKGLPATPRDGAAVEINGMLGAVLGWVVADALINAREFWKWEAVYVRDADGKDKPIKFVEWKTMVHRSFERTFYIPTDITLDLNYSVDRPDLVNRRGIYKDTVGSSLEYADYQLRPNFCIAMAMAPELFDPAHARAALEVVKEVLLGPLGMKTLDPSDWSYRGVYDNANDGTDPSVAHGYNYHQGPEWVWVTGFFLRAYLHFNTRAEGHDPAK
ncbi:glucanotransferase domain of glycogen debranching enzyme-domain-containing protein, partial [Blyttiomyces helicus]